MHVPRIRLHNLDNNIISLTRLTWEKRLIVFMLANSINNHKLYEDVSSLDAKMNETVQQ